MYRIVRAEELTTNIYLMEVEAERVAKYCQPGQFVIVRMDAEGERIPLTICDYDKKQGTVAIVFQTVGASTKGYGDNRVPDCRRVHPNDVRSWGGGQLP